LWDDSIASNQAARRAAHEQGDLGEELHSMDYLTYAYLQRGRYAQAEQIVAALHAMKDLPATQFKVAYAATAMPVRLAIERRIWDNATALQPMPQSAPQAAALVYWAHALGHARSAQPQLADGDIGQLRACQRDLQSAGNTYWATLVDALVKEAEGWLLAADGHPDAAILSLRAAADEEDALEKLPVTPGPVIPAREQLGELFLDLKRPAQALREFQASLALAPGRRGALLGAIRAAEQSGDSQAAARLRGQLPP
jgi:tetratricopeptide (TPR) repeat protein